jgi:hypothetical protein
MGEIAAIRPGVSKAQMRRATEAASLRMAHHSDQVRMVEDKILAIGYFIAVRHRPEFLKVLQYLETGLPMNEESIRASIFVWIFCARGSQRDEAYALHHGPQS